MPSASASCSGTTTAITEKVFGTASVKLMSSAMRLKLRDAPAALAWNATAMVCTSGTKNSAARKTSDGAIRR